MEKKLLSLDIWDTVIRRRCHPQESKFGLSKYVLLKYNHQLKDEYKKVLPKDLVKIRCDCECEISKENSKKGFDEEYVINEVLILWIDKIIGYLPEYKKNILVEEFIEYELKHEMYVSYLDSTICTKIKEKEYDKLIYISDFYMSKSYLDRLLEKYKNEIIFDDGLVSCDYKLNKRSGKLFNEIENKFGVTYEKHFHIGDNKVGDVKSPKKIGINTERYLPLKEHIIRTKHRLDYIFRCRLCFGSKSNSCGYIRTVKKQLNNLFSDDEYVNLGIEHSLYFITYILSVIETAIKEQVDKVYYFTREGEFFKQMHDAIEKADVFGFPIPKAEILEVSRMSTYAPSIKEISIDGMMRLWSQYPNQSLDAFFKSLNSSVEHYKSLLLKYGLVNIDKPLKNIIEQDSIIRLFRDEEFTEKLTEEIENKKRLFLKYLQQKDIHLNTEKLFVVDIGWRGSIQDNIALILPNTEVIGCYMGLFRPYSDSVDNSRKIGFVSSNEDENNIWYLRHPYPLEMYTNSRNGSVVGYTETDKGYVSAIRNNYAKEDIIYDKYVKKFQQGILLTIPTYGQMIRTYSFNTDELMPYAIKSLKNLIVKPNKLLTIPFFNLVDNNTFGIGKLEDMSLKFDFRIFLKSFTSIKRINELIDNIEESHWPHGVFMRYHLTLINWIYCKFAERMYLHYNCIKPLGYSKRSKISLKSFKQIPLRISYKREKLVSNSVCLYIRGSVIIPKELGSEYDIFLYIDDKKRTFFFDTVQIVKYIPRDKDQITFEAKIPWSNSYVKNKNQKIIVINREKDIYTIFEI